MKLKELLRLVEKKMKNEEVERIDVWVVLEGKRNLISIKKFEEKFEKNLFEIVSGGGSVVYEWKKGKWKENCDFCELSDDCDLKKCKWF